MAYPLVEAEQLQVSLNGTRILDNLNFQMEKGGLTGIIGPNGSGKTTLLRAISGVQPFTGRLDFQGQSVANWDKKILAQHLSILPQNPTISFDFQVRDYVMLGRIPHKRWLEAENTTDRELVTEVLNALDLLDLSERTIPSLSGGERQRVLLAQALVQDTTMLLLDEPTSHLDVYHQFDLLKRIRRLVNDGKTILAVFHDLSLAARFTDQLLVLKDGRLVEHGNTSSVLTAPLIKDVFRMSAQLSTTGEASTRIHYIDQS